MGGERERGEVKQKIVTTVDPGLPCWSFFTLSKMVRIISLWEIFILNNNLFDVALNKAICQTDLFLELIDMSINHHNQTWPYHKLEKKKKN